MKQKFSLDDINIFLFFSLFIIWKFSLVFCKNLKESEVLIPLTKGKGSKGILILLRLDDSVEIQKMLLFIEIDSEIVLDLSFIFDYLNE